MSEGTRRVFLAGSGVGAAVVGLAALTPTVTGAAEPGASARLLAGAESGASAVTGSMVAVVHDVADAEVSLLIGEEEIVVRDRDLVARLVRAAGR